MLGYRTTLDWFIVHRSEGQKYSQQDALRWKTEYEQMRRGYDRAGEDESQKDKPVELPPEQLCSLGARELVYATATVGEGLLLAADMIHHI